MITIPSPYPSPVRWRCWRRAQERSEPPFIGGETNPSSASQLIVLLATSDGALWAPTLVYAMTVKYHVPDPSPCTV